MANQTLISGAGKAVKKDPNLIKSLGYSKVGEQMFDAFAEVAIEKNRLRKEFDKSVSSYLSKESYLDGAVLADIMDTLEKDRKQYIWGSKKDKLLLKSKMEKLRVEYDNNHNALDELAAVMEHPLTKVNDDWKETNEGQSITGIFNGTNKAIPNPDFPEGTIEIGELGFMVVNENGEAEWKSRDEIKDLIQSNSRDAQTESLIQEQVGTAIQWATNKVWTDYNDFQDTRFESNMQKIINNASNLRSLTHDSMAGLDDSFYGNLTNAIASGNWEAIGLTADQIQEYNLVNNDVDGDGRVTVEDAEMIASIFVGDMDSPVNQNGEPIWQYDEQAHRDMISRMFFIYAKRQWAESLDGHERWKYDWYYNKGKTPAQIDEEVKRRQDETHSQRLLSQGTTVQ